MLFHCFPSVKHWLLEIIPPFGCLTLALTLASFTRKLEDLSLDEFLQSGDFESEGEDDCQEDSPKQNGLGKKNKKKKDKSASPVMWVFWNWTVVMFTHLWVSGEIKE